MALSSFGTLLQIGDGVTPVEGFTTIAEVRDITGPSLELGTEDVTSHSSTSGWREFVTTLLGGGEVSFEINFTPTGATHRNQAGGLLYQFEQKIRRNWRLTLPGATNWLFTGYVTSFEVNAPTEGALTASVTITLTGAPTLA